MAAWIRAGVVSRPAHAADTQPSASSKHSAAAARSSAVSSTRVRGGSSTGCRASSARFE
jgi:hypothetical protein